MSLTPNIPFQPGLALGSIVRGDYIEYTEKFQKSLKQIEHLKTQIQMTQLSITDLEKKLLKIKQQGYISSQKVLEEMLMKRQLMLKELMYDLELQSQACHGLEFPIGVNILAGLESPIDFTQSKIITTDRGYEGASFHSCYLNLKHQGSFKDSVTYDNTLESLFSHFKSIVPIETSYSLFSHIKERVETIRKVKSAAGIFLMTSILQSTQVQAFKKEIYDPRKLKKILQIMNEDNPEWLKSKGITQVLGSKNIYLLTEAMMGGFFSVIMTIFDRTITSRDYPVGKRSHYSQLFKVEQGKNLATEFISLGAIPQSHQSSILQSISRCYQEHRNTLGSEPPYFTDQGQGSKEAFCAKLEVATDPYTLTVNEMMNMYQNFCEIIAGNEPSGIPMSFNYTVLTEEKIKQMVGNI